jgi:hypothetical protein
MTTLPTKLARAAGAIALTSLLASGAFAATAAPLPSGKPAGVQQAGLQGSGLIWIGAAAIIAVTVAVVASSNNDGVTTPTTGTGTP